MIGIALGIWTRRQGSGVITPPPEAPDGQWDFSNAAQSGHLLTAGF